MHIGHSQNDLYSAFLDYRYSLLSFVIVVIVTKVCLINLERYIEMCGLAFLALCLQGNIRRLKAGTGSLYYSFKE